MGYTKIKKLNSNNNNSFSKHFQLQISYNFNGNNNNNIDIGGSNQGNKLNGNINLYPNNSFGENHIMKTNLINKMSIQNINMNLKP